MLELVVERSGMRPCGMVKVEGLETEGISDGSSKGLANIRRAFLGSIDVLGWSVMRSSWNSAENRYPCESYGT